MKKEEVIILSPLGKKVFPNLIGLKAWKVTNSRGRGLASKDFIKVRVEGYKTINTYNKSFWMGAGILC